MDILRVVMGHGTYQAVAFLDWRVVFGFNTCNKREKTSYKWLISAYGATRQFLGVFDLSLISTKIAANIGENGNRPVQYWNFLREYCSPIEL